MTDYLKEYLVKLGFKVDNQQYNQFKKALQGAEGDTKTFSSGMTANMATSAAAVLTFVAAANVGIASYLGSLARADMDTELFARRMWITADQGKAIQESLKATGRSMEDVWFSPELRAQFTELQKVANDVKPPAEFKNQMKDIRDVSLEFMKLRVILAYALQWIGYYLSKDLAEPIANIKEAMVEINAYVRANMPTITRDIAKFLSGFVSMGEAAVWVLIRLGSLISDLPDNVEAAGAALAVMFAIMAASPMGLMLIGLSGLMLLLEDFYTFSEGGKSALPGLWSWVSDTFGKGSEFADEFDDSVNQLHDDLQLLFNIMTDLKENFDKENTFSHMIDAFKAEYELVKNIEQKVRDLIKALTDLAGIGDTTYGKYVKEFVEEGPKKFWSNRARDAGNAMMGEGGGNTAGEYAAPMSNWFFDTIKGLSEGLSQMITGNNPVPSGQSGNQSNINQTIQNTNNIYGSDAYAIGTQVNRNWNNMEVVMRDLQGVYR